MLVLGIDGGGTKTQALAMDEYGRVIASARLGPSNYREIGLEAALDVLEALCQQVLNGRSADVAAFCLSDCDTSQDEARLREGIQRRGMVGRFACYNDAFAVLRAGSTRSYGVGVICGTGFNACGIGPDGRRASLHALGQLTGDWGGGYALGVAICGAVFRAAEGRGEATILTEMLFKALAVTDIEILAQQILDDRLSFFQITALAPLVFEAAHAGDKIALEIIHHQADEIAIAARAMINRLAMQNLPVDVVLGGGVVQSNGPLLPAIVTQILTPAYPLANVKTLTVPPVLGATLLAFDLLGVPVPAVQETWLQEQK